LNLLYDEIESPIGPLLLVVGDDLIHVAEFDSDPEQVRARLEPRFRSYDLTPRKNPSGYSKKMRDYFKGDLRAIDEIQVHRGGTPFQNRVWKELRAIPAGETCSYADIARAIGRPTATRAVGAANGRNPIAIIVPCHRVIGADGTLTGYGGGLDRKRWLLEHEGAGVPQETGSLF